MNTLYFLASFASADIPITKDNVRPGWIALGVVFALGVATFFLVRSFIKHSKRASQPWDGDQPSS